MTSPLDRVTHLDLVEVESAYTDLPDAPRRRPH